MAFNVPEKYRWTKYSNKSDGNNGMFLVPRHSGGAPLKIQASDGGRWEHVSVSLPDRPPTWDEMSRIKSLFWDKNDTVIQFHPAEDEHVNNHENCLHLWRPKDQDIPTPNPILVGLKDG